MFIFNNPSSPIPVFLKIDYKIFGNISFDKSRNCLREGFPINLLKDPTNASIYLRSIKYDIFN